MRDCRRQHRGKSLPGKGMPRLAFLAHAGPEWLLLLQGVGGRVLRLRPPYGELRAHMGSLGAQGPACPCLAWIQPGSLGVTFRAPCLATYTHIHIYTRA